MADKIQLASGATEADIIRALADLPDGGTVVLPDDETIALHLGLNIDVADRDITLDLNGSTLQRAGDVSMIVARGAHDEAVGVKLRTDADGNTVAVYAERPADVTAGAWVKLISDDKLPGDHLEGILPSRMGQAMEVLSVAGNTVTFKGALIDQGNYDINVRASTYHSGELIVRDGEIVGDQRHASWNMPLIQLRSLVDAQVEDLSLRDSVGRGISVVDGVNNQLTDITVKNLLDGGTAALGIAVSSASSSRTTVEGLYAESVMHGADANAIGLIANSNRTERYGGDIGMEVSHSVAVDARDFAWSWHSESVDGAFHDVMAFDSYGFLTARGIGGEMRDSGGAGNGRGILFYEYGDGDGRDITVDEVTLRETEHYSVFAANGALNNTISNSFFGAYGPGNLALPRQVAVDATAFIVEDANPNDIITGTSGGDMLLGGRGADTISGSDGDDYIWGGTGPDVLTGGYGRDRFTFHSLDKAPDTISDFYAGNAGDVLDLSILAAHYGWDTGDPIASGHLRFLQAGDDVLVQVDRNGGGNEFATLATLAGVDASQVISANWMLRLSDAATPPMAEADGTLRGTDGNDVLRASIEINHIIGGGGDDKLSASVTDTLLEGGAGDDTLSGNRGDDILKGGPGHDLMAGGAGLDKLIGEAGNDTLIGGPDADVLAGGVGYDTADYSTSAAAVSADILAGGGSGGDAAGDRFSSIENLIGSDFNDALRGNQITNILNGGAGDDQLFGRAGADILRGGDGADWLDGGAWKDVLTGGTGADNFFFANSLQAGDTITDFQTGTDHLVLLGAGFGIEGDHGFAFVEALEATSADPTLLFDESSDRLLWDPDGTGVQRAVVLANLSEAASLSAADILIG